MTTPITCEVVYTYKCRGCDKRNTESTAIYSGQSVLYPSVPNGWRVISGMTYCDTCTVELVINGETKITL